ncbi:MAG: cadherin domain-containing protein [Magnetococcales bacterium]|nr:cadherin domain-containing protein [Magnetococcales bacterium]
MGNLFQNKWFIAILLLTGITVAGGYLLLAPEGEKKQSSIAQALQNRAPQPQRAIQPTTLATDQNSDLTPLPVQAASQSIYKREVVALVTQVKGLVFAQFGDKKRTLTLGAPIFQGDKLITGKKGRLILKMHDDAVIALGADSEFLIQQYQYSHPKKSGRGLLEMSKGLLKFTSGKLAQLKERPFHIITSVATMGVRGTEGFISLSGPTEDQELEMVTLKKEVVVWMEKPENNLSSSNGRFYFALPTLLSSAQAADLTKKPTSVKKNQSLTASTTRGPSVQPATRKQLKKAITSTVVKTLNEAAKQQIVDQVAQSLVEAGTAATVEEARAILEKTPDAIAELIEAAEDKLLEQVANSVEEALIKEEKIQSLEDEFKVAVGEQAYAKIQEARQEQQEAEDQLAEETRAELEATVGDPELVDQVQEVAELKKQALQESDEQAKTELEAQIGADKVNDVLAIGAEQAAQQQALKEKSAEQINEVLAGETNLVESVKQAQQLANSGSATDEELLASLEQSLPKEQAEKILDIFREAQTDSKNIDQQANQKLQAVVPPEQLEATQAILTEKQTAIQNAEQEAEQTLKETLPAPVAQQVLGTLDKQAKKSQELATESAKKQTEAIPATAREAVKQIQQQQAELKKGPSLDQLTSAETTSSIMNEVMTELNEQVGQFSQEVKAAVENNKTLEEALQEKAQTWVDAKISESAEMGIDLTEAKQAAEQASKEAEIPKGLTKAVEKKKKEKKEKTKKDQGGADIDDIGVEQIDDTPAEEIPSQAPTTQGTPAGTATSPDGLSSNLGSDSTSPNPVDTSNTSDNTDSSTSTWSASNVLSNASPVLADTTFTVNENNAANTVVGTVSATDTNSDDVLSYSISEDTSGLFTISSSSGTITILEAGVLDYETAAVYNLTVAVSDNYVNAFGEAKPGIASATITIQVGNVNETPTVAAASAQTVLEDIATNLDDIVVADPDIGSLSTNTLIVTLETSNGTVTAGGTTGLTVTGNSSSTLSLTGTPTDLNIALTKLYYTGNENFVGTDTLDITVTDTDKKTPLKTATAMTLTIEPVNDQPSFTLSSTQETLQEDAGAQSYNSFAADLAANGGSDEADQTFSFTVSNDNSQLFASQPAIDSSGKLTFTPADNAFGTAVLTITLTDSGGTDNEGVDTTAEQTVTITIDPVADTPSITEAGETSEEVQTSSGLVVSRSANDGEEVSHFKISGITNGTLYQNNGLTAISNGEFLTYAQANAGLKFTPDDNLNSSNSSFYFTIQSALSADEASLGGDPVTASIPTVHAVNDQPSFSLSSTQETLLEDAGSQSYSAFATDLASNGGSDEADQTFSFTVSNDNTELFAIQPALDTTGNLTFTPADNAFGTAILTITLTDSGGTDFDGVDISVEQTVTVTIDPVADTPSITEAGETNEETQTGSGLVISRNINDGAEISHFQITSISNGTLYQNDGITAISNGDFITFAQGDAGLKFTPDDNLNSLTSSFGFVIQASVSNQTTGLGGDLVNASIPTVNAVNDQPSFVLSSTAESLAEDAGDLTYSGFVTDLAANGGSDETGQTFSFSVSNDNSDLFANQPAIDSSGTLTFTPADNAFGTAILTITMTDSGGTDFDGVNTSTEQTVTLTINPVADTPSISDGSSTLEDTQTSSGLVISRSSNDGEEVTHFQITNISNGTLYQNDGTTAISDGNFITVDQGGAGLKFTPDLNLNSETSSFGFMIQAALSDSVTDLGGDQVTASIPTVTAVNDQPSFILTSSTVSVLEDSGEYNDIDFFSATDSGGSTDETSSQTFTYSVTNDNNALFATQPKIDSTGTLTFTPADNAFGSTEVSITQIDNGGIENGGIDTSETQTVTLTVVPVADTPSITDGGETLEDTQTTSGLVISRNSNDSDEVTHFQITNITNGTLYQNDGATIISEGTFITFAEGAAGLKFTPGTDMNDVNHTFSFDIQAATSDSTADLGGDLVMGVIPTVTAVNDQPSFEMTSTTLTVDEDSGAYTGSSFFTTLEAGGLADESDSQTFTFTVTNDNAGLFSTEPSIDSNGALIFTPADDANGEVVLTLTMTDSGGTENGGVDVSESQTVTLTITAINDDPVITVPISAAIDASSTVTFSAANGNAISVVDVDAASGIMEAALVVSNGTATLSQTTGLTVSGNGTASLSFSGTLDDINSALDGLLYTADGSFSGTESLTFSIDDNGNTGSGGGATQTATVPLSNIIIYLSMEQVYADSPIGTVIGFLTVDSPVSGTVYTFSVADQTYFSVANGKDTSTYRYGSLTVNDANLVSGVDYDVDVTVTTDSGQSITTAFTITGTTRPFDDSGMIDVTQSGALLHANATTIYQNMVAAMAPDTPSSFSLSETDLRTLILAKLNQQLTGSTASLTDISDIVSAIGVDVTSSQIEITMRIKALNAIYNRLSSTVQASFKNLVDTIATYGDNFTFDIKLTVVPAMNGTKITYTTGSQLEIIHLLIVDSVAFSISDLISYYNTAVSNLSSDGSTLTFFTGGSVPLHILEGALDRDLALSTSESATSLGYANSYGTTSHTISTSGVELSYYLPGKISSYTLGTGTVTLNP